MWSGGINNKHKALKKSVDSLRYRAISNGQRWWKIERFKCQLNFFRSAIGLLALKKHQRYTSDSWLENGLWRLPASIIKDTALANQI